MKCMATSKPSRIEVQPDVWLDSRRAVFLASAKLLVVADLHWGYAVAHRAAGNLLPLWGDELIARTLRELVCDYAPAEVIWLGDCLHSVSGRVSAESFLVECERSGTSVRVLAGNHDRRWQVPTARVFQRGRYVLHHGDEPSPPLGGGAVELIGHHHPAATLWDGAGTRLRLPALVASPARLILPAFSPWAAGTPWNERLLPTENLWAIAPSRIFAVRSPHSRPSPAKS
jgi:uncharacterized protein